MLYDRATLVQLSPGKLVYVGDKSVIAERLYRFHMLLWEAVAVKSLKELYREKCLV